MASARLGVGACIQRGKLEKTRPLGDTATPLRIAFGDAATRINSCVFGITVLPWRKTINLTEPRKPNHVSSDEMERR
jgi:hypothetical protein